MWPTLSYECWCTLILYTHTVQYRPDCYTKMAFVYLRVAVVTLYIIDLVTYSLKVAVFGNAS